MNPSDQLDTTVTAREIMRRDDALTKRGKLLKDYAIAWANAKKEHDKAYGITMAQLEAGAEFIVNGVTIKGKATTTIKKKVEAIIAEEYAEPLDLAKKQYDNLLHAIDILQSQLNGWQSINKHLAIT